MKKIISLALLFLIPTISLAEQKVYELADFPEQKSYFDMIGKRYVAKKDNPFLMERFYNPTLPIYYKVFLKEPNQDLCKKNSCDRKRIITNMKFVAEAIISPSETAQISQCNENIIFCYFKLRFDDGDVTYMQVFNFITAISPTNTTAMNHMGFLQAYPLNPDESWRREKRFFDIYFKERGARQGYTKEEVLKSQWGEPFTKTHSSSKNVDIDVWLYDSGMLTFENGYVTSVTTSR